jgi:hypothetical protein
MMAFQSSGDSRCATCLFVLLLFPARQILKSTGFFVYYLIHTTWTPCLVWLLSEINLINHHISRAKDASPDPGPSISHPTRIPCHLDLERSSLPIPLSSSSQPRFSITCLPTEACLCLPIRVLAPEHHLGTNERHCLSSSIAGIRASSIRSSLVFPT